MEEEVAGREEKLCTQAESCSLFSFIDCWRQSGISMLIFVRQVDVWRDTWTASDSFFDLAPECERVVDSCYPLVLAWRRKGVCSERV